MCDKTNAEDKLTPLKMGSVRFWSTLADISDSTEMNRNPYNTHTCSDGSDTCGYQKHRLNEKIRRHQSCRFTAI